MEGKEEEFDFISPLSQDSSLSGVFANGLGINADV
jgi:hypothetical protein